MITGGLIEPPICMTWSGSGLAAGVSRATGGAVAVEGGGVCCAPMYSAVGTMKVAVRRMAKLLSEIRMEITVRVAKRLRFLPDGRSFQLRKDRPSLHDREVDVDVQIDFDGLAVQHRWLELVLPHSLDRLLIQPHPHAAHHLHMRRIAVLIHPQINLDVARELRLARLLGELRLDLVDERRGLHGTADVHHAAADVPAQASTDAAAIAAANARSM